MPSLRLPKESPIPHTHLRRGARISLAIVLMSLAAFYGTRFYLLWEHRVCDRVARRDGAVALTFDDGPDPRFTPAVLDILAEHDAKATFFVVGDQVERHPQLLERIVAEGHEIGHHSHSHRRMRLLDAVDITWEIESCLSALERHGIEPAWYRPPRKELCFRQKDAAHRYGMDIALWNVEMESPRHSTAEEMAEEVIGETDSGDVLIGHDGIHDRTMTVEALPDILRGLKRKGLRFVTLSELAANETRYAAATE